MTSHATIKTRAAVRSLRSGLNKFPGVAVVKRGICCFDLF